MISALFIVVDLWSMAALSNHMEHLAILDTVLEKKSKRVLSNEYFLFFSILLSPSVFMLKLHVSMNYQRIIQMQSLIPLNVY